MACLVLRETSKWWYGKYRHDSKEYVKNLHVSVRGAPPATLAETGSKQFELSRAEAQAALNALVSEVQSGRSTEALAQAVYQARTGEKLRRYTLKDLPRIWQEKPRKRPPIPEHAAQCKAKLTKFADFIAKHDPKVVRVDQLRPSHVRAFLDDLDQSGVTAETWNKYLILIKAVLKRAGVTAASETVTKDAETVFREPYTLEELKAIFTAAESDALMLSLIITAACTAMRRKDCCFLRWDAVDLKAGFITVKTSKTGVVVDIPMADMLRAQIGKQKGNGSEYVFPEAKLLYESDPSALTRRFKQVLRCAGFTDQPPVEHRTDPYMPEELNEKAEEIYQGKKLAHALAVLKAYTGGQCVRKSATAAGVTVSTASLYLNELEKATGKEIIRGKCRPVQIVTEYSETAPPPPRGAISKKREKGLLRASVRDFHSFRTTFVTLALMNGMPLDTVRKITGHQTASVVTKHYFRPEREQLKAAMQKNLPGLLTSATTAFTPAQKAADALRTATAKNWQKKIDEALKILEEV